MTTDFCSLCEHPTGQPPSVIFIPMVDRIRSDHPANISDRDQSSAARGSVVGRGRNGPRGLSMLVVFILNPCLGSLPLMYSFNQRPVQPWCSFPVSFIFSWMSSSRYPSQLSSPPRLSVRPLKHPGCLGSRESRRFGWFTRWFLPLSPCSDEPRIFTWPKRSPAGSTGISCASTSSCVEPPCLPACRPVTQRQRSPFRGIVFFFQPLTNRLLKKINSPVGLRETFVVLRFVFGSVCTP